MTLRKLTIHLDEEEIKILEKRAKKNLFTLKEQVEDIVRRSVISTKKRGSSRPPKINDKLVGIFSRHRTGPKRKKKQKKTK